MLLKSDSNIDVTYEKSDSKRVFYGNYALMSSLASMGYLDTQRYGDSYTIMNKPSQIIFKIKEGPYKGIYRIRENVKLLYDSKKLDNYLFKRFVSDLEAKRVSWSFDKNRKIHFSFIPEPGGHQMTLFEYVDKKEE